MIDNPDRSCTIFLCTCFFKDDNNMHSVNPTQLRKNLFEELSLVLNGETVLIKTQKGNALLVSEKLFKLTTTSDAEFIPEAPKISGKIIGDLADAEEALSKHLLIPGDHDDSIPS